MRSLLATMVAVLLSVALASFLSKAAIVEVPSTGLVSTGGRTDRQADLLIGYTELRTNLPSRHANVVTMRAAIVNGDGTGHRLVGEELAREPNSWTQFAGWSPDGCLRSFRSLSS